jgi:hypothetical protein
LCWRPLYGERFGASREGAHGYVVEGRLYSATSDIAYPVYLSPPVDLRSYEGKSLRIKGQLHPGTKFSIKDETAIQVTSNTCHARLRKAIDNDRPVAYRVEAGGMARKGNFSEALVVIGKALEIDSSDCGTYTDRAQIYCLNGEIVGYALGSRITKDLDRFTVYQTSCFSGGL